MSTRTHHQSYLLIGGDRSGQWINTNGEPYWSIPRYNRDPVTSFSQQPPIARIENDEYELRSNLVLGSAYVIRSMTNQKAYTELRKIRRQYQYSGDTSTRRP